MKKFIINFQETGICEVNVSKLVKDWSNKFSISQFNDKYTLVKQGKGERHAKVEISEAQALEIIKEAKLLKIQSSLFKSGKTYKSKGNILSEISRLSSIIEEKSSEVTVLEEVLSEYVNAMNSVEG